MVRHKFCGPCVSTTNMRFYNVMSSGDSYVTVLRIISLLMFHHSFISLLRELRRSLSSLFECLDHLKRKSLSTTIISISFIILVFTYSYNILPFWYVTYNQFISLNLTFPLLCNTPRVLKWCESIYISVCQIVQLRELSVHCVWG